MKRNNENMKKNKNQNIETVSEKSRGAKLRRFFPVISVVMLVGVLLGLKLLQRGGEGNMASAHSQESQQERLPYDLKSRELAEDEFYRFKGEPGRLLEYAFCSSLTLEYQLNTKALSAAHYNGMEIPELSASRDITGNLVLASYAWADPDFLVVGYIIEGLKVSARSEFDVEDVETQFPPYEVFAKISSRGEVDTIYFPHELTAEVKNTIRMILAESQVLLPEKMESAWEAKEWDMTGNYHADYTGTPRSLNGSKPVLELIKSKRRYEKNRVSDNNSSDNNSIELEIDAKLSYKPSGETQFIFLPEEGYLMGLLFRGAMEVESGVGLFKKYHGEFTMNWELKGVGFDPERARMSSEEVAGRLWRMDLSFPWDNKELKALSHSKGVSWDLRLVDGRTLFEMVEEMKLMLANANLDKDELQRLCMALQALFRLNPDAIEEALSLLKSEDLAGEIREAIIQAFGVAGTPEAQQGLATLFSNMEIGIEDKMNVLYTTACHIKMPTEALVAAIRTGVDGSDTTGVGANSLNTLAILGERLSLSDSDGAREIVDVLLAQESEYKPSIFLTALANFGGSQNYDVVAPYLESKSSHVRAKALMAVKGSDRDAVQIQLVKALKDNTPSVQKAAIKALKARKTPKAQAALRQDFQERPAGSKMKTNILRALSSMSSPETTQFLEQVAVGDPDEKVRNLAKQVLAGRVY